MAKFRRRVVAEVIYEATQWFKTGDHPDDYASDTQGFENGQPRTFSGAERKANKWEGSVVRRFRNPDVPGTKKCEHCALNMDGHGWIDTRQGGHIVCPGDWIITEMDGKGYYPCKPDVFAKNYQAIPE